VRAAWVFVDLAVASFASPPEAGVFPSGIRQACQWGRAGTLGKAVPANVDARTFEDIVSTYYESLYRFAFSLTQREADARFDGDLQPVCPKGHQLRDKPKSNPGSSPLYRESSIRTADTCAIPRSKWTRPVKSYRPRSHCGQH
jgi:hypothetical protein